MSKYKINMTNKFKKDFRKMKSRKNFDSQAFETVVDLLSNDEILPEKYHNHLLEPKSNRHLGMPYQT